jgi:hypothetical protein
MNITGGPVYIDQNPLGTGSTYGFVSGTIDSANVHFTVSQNKYGTGKLTVFKNLIRQQGSGEEWFEVDPNTGKFDFVTAPVPGDIITVQYQTFVGSGGNAGIQVLNSGSVLGTFTKLNLVNPNISAVDAGGGQVDISTLNTGSGGGGNGAWSLISTSTVSAVSLSDNTLTQILDITSLDGDTDDTYMIDFELGSSGSMGANGVFALRINTDSVGNHYVYSPIYNSGTGVGSIANSSGATTELHMIDGQNLESTSGTIRIKATKTAGGTRRLISWDIAVGAAAEAQKSNGGGNWTDTTNNITSVQLFYLQNSGSTRTISGLVSLYKINRNNTGGGGNSEKKVGVGEISDINWFNVQYPFSGPSGTTSDFLVWDMNNSGTTINPSANEFAENQYITTNIINFNSFLPDFDTNGELQYDSGKQTIAQFVVKTKTSTGTDGGGVGFGPANVVNSQGVVNGDPEICFVRESATGQWYARTSDVTFTETPITISDGKHVFRIEYDPANTQARFYVDGVLLATNTTDLPLARTENMLFTGGNDAGINDLAINILGCPSFSVEI